MNEQPQPKLIDTHAHLEMAQFEPDRAEVIARAKGQGIQVITVGIDLGSSREAIALAEEFDLYAAVGVHPHEARRYPDLEGLKAELRELAAHPRVVALGEMGLDFYRNYSPREAQLKVLKAQLELAQELKKPVILHDRKADEELLKLLEEYRPQGVVHSFSSSLEVAERLLELGLYLGFSGPLTFPRARQRAVAAAVSLERILLETDAPFLTPAPHRGKRNEPAYVHHVAEALAALQQRSLDEVCQVTTANAVRLFRLA